MIASEKYKTDYRKVDTIKIDIEIKTFEGGAAIKTVKYFWQCSAGRYPVIVCYYSIAITIASSRPWCAG